MLGPASEASVVSGKDRGDVAICRKGGECFRGTHLPYHDKGGRSCVYDFHPTAGRVRSAFDDRDRPVTFLEPGQMGRANDVVRLCSCPHWEARMAARTAHFFQDREPPNPLQSDTGPRRGLAIAAKLYNSSWTIRSVEWRERARSLTER